MPVKERKRRGCRPWPCVLLALVLFSVFAPWIPYSPYCRYDDFRKLEGRLSDAFLSSMTFSLEVNYVPFFEIGGVILLRFRDWGYETSNVSRAQRLAIARLFSERLRTDVGAIPEHVKAFLHGDNEYNEDDCHVTRAVAIEWETGSQAVAE